MIHERLSLTAESGGVMPRVDPLPLTDGRHHDDTNQLINRRSTRSSLRPQGGEEEEAARAQLNEINLGALRRRRQRRRWRGEGGGATPGRQRQRLPAAAVIVAVEAVEAVAAAARLKTLTSALTPRRGQRRAHENVGTATVVGDVWGESGGQMGKRLCGEGLLKGAQGEVLLIGAFFLCLWKQTVIGCGGIFPSLCEHLPLPWN